MKILILLAVNLVMFYRTMRFTWANDDWEIAKCNCNDPVIVDVKDGHGIPFRMCKRCGIKERPHVGFWKMLHTHFFGLGYWNAKLAHAMTLGVHIINTTLIYLAFGSNDISFMTALLFAIHPVATQGSSVWLSGRNYGCATALTLLMKYLPFVAPVIYVAMFRFALISAPSPAMFIGTKWWFWIFLIPVMMYFMRKTVGKSTEMKFRLVSMTRKPFDKNNIILFFKTLGYYFCIYIFPTHLGVHHTYLERYGLTKEETKYALKLDGFLFLGIGMVLLIAYLAIWHWSNPITYGLLWMFLFIFPWLNICTIIQQIAERYCVLSLIGALFAFVNLLMLIPYGMYLYIGFIGYYACRTQIYIKIYADVLRCAEHNTENFEDSAAAWRWRGGLERNLGLVNEAFISWMKAWRLRPYDFVLCNNIATILCQRGQWDEAQKFMDMAKKCPLPTPELAAKWKERQDQFQAEFDKHKAIRDSMMKQGRNELCKCGSGKKFKHCHGKGE